MKSRDSAKTVPIFDRIFVSHNLIIPLASDTLNVNSLFRSFRRQNIIDVWTEAKRNRLNICLADGAVETKQNTKWSHFSDIYISFTRRCSVFRFVLIFDLRFWAAYALIAALFYFQLLENNEDKSQPRRPNAHRSHWMSMNFYLFACEWT